MPRSKRALTYAGGFVIGLILALVGPELYAQGRMVTTTGVVFVRGIIGSLPVTVANIVTTSTAGLTLQNTTAATVGVPVQISPSLLWSGQGWDTDDAVTRPVRFGMQVLPTGTTTVAGTLETIYLDPITSAITKPLTLTSSGNLTALATVTGSVLTGANTAGNVLSLNNTAADAPVTGSVYETFSTASVIRWYLGMSAATVSGNFELYDNIGALGTVASWDKTSGVLTAAKGLATPTIVTVGTNMTLRGTVPTVTGGGSTCGTTAPVLVGTDTAGKVTTGSVAPTICVVTFSSAWTNAPSCGANNETTANLLKPTSTTTTLTMTGTMVAGDVLSYRCVGY